MGLIKSTGVNRENATEKDTEQPQHTANKLVSIVDIVVVAAVVAAIAAVVAAIAAVVAAIAAVVAAIALAAAVSFLFL